jgi:hypothetical protein
MAAPLKYKLLILLLLLPVLSFSQQYRLTGRRVEATVGLGSTHYFGDIGGAESENNLLGLKDIDLFTTRPNVNFGGRYRINENMNVRANLVFGYLEGNDLNSKNEARNYAFSTSVYEFTGVYEYCIIPEQYPINYRMSSLWDGLSFNNASLNTYVFGGLGFTYFDVTPLQDLKSSDGFHTGSNMSLVVPLGVGIKYPIASAIHLSFEFGGRWAATDYLDGYTSKWSTANDVYYFSMLNVVIKIDAYSRGGFGR